MVFRTTTNVARSTNGSSYAQYNLTAANLGIRGADVVTNYEFFRVVSLHVYAYCDTVVPGTTVSQNAGIDLGLSFLNTASGSQTIPNTKLDMAQHEHCVFGPPLQKLSLKVGRRDLLAEPYKWFHTDTTGSIDATDLSAGVVTQYFQTSIPGTQDTMTMHVVIEGVCEMHTPISYTDALRVRVPRNLSSDPSVTSAVSRLKKVIEAAEEDTPRTRGQ